MNVESKITSIIKDLLKEDEVLLPDICKYIKENWGFKSFEYIKHLDDNDASLSTKTPITFWRRLKEACSKYVNDNLIYDKSINSNGNYINQGSVIKNVTVNNITDNKIYTEQDLNDNIILIMQHFQLKKSLDIFKKATTRESYHRNLDLNELYNNYCASLNAKDVDKPNLLKHIAKCANEVFLKRLLLEVRSAHNFFYVLNYPPSKLSSHIFDHVNVQNYVDLIFESVIKLLVPEIQSVVANSCLNSNYKELIKHKIRESCKNSRNYLLNGLNKTKIEPADEHEQLEEQVEVEDPINKTTGKKLKIKSNSTTNNAAKANNLNNANNKKDQFEKNNVVYPSDNIDEYEPGNINLIVNDEFAGIYQDVMKSKNISDYILITKNEKFDVNIESNLNSNQTSFHSSTKISEILDLLILNKTKSLKRKHPSVQENSTQCHVLEDMNQELHTSSFARPTSINQEINALLR